MKIVHCRIKIYNLWREEREREREREKERQHEGFENDVYKENAQIFPLDGHLHNNAFLSRCFLG